MANLALQDLIIRLFAAWLSGVLLGLERQRRGKPVGISTYVLVSVSACSIAILSAYGLPTSHATTPTDPARLMVGILSGIGFLGAGIIWRSQEGGIYGLTTAADIWATTCLGIVWGIGQFVLGFFTFVLILGTLFVVKNPRFLTWRQKHSPPTSSHEEE